MSLENKNGNPNLFHVRFSIFMCRRKTLAIFSKEGKNFIFFKFKFFGNTEFYIGIVEIENNTCCAGIPDLFRVFSEHDIYITVSAAHE
jgi:hypothetical protein